MSNDVGSLAHLFCENPYWGMGSVNPTLGRMRQEGCCEVKTSIGYIVSATQPGPQNENQKSKSQGLYILAGKEKMTRY